MQTASFKTIPRRDLLIDDRIWGDIRGMEVVKCQLTLPAFFDLISAHILIKMKENNWSGEYMYIVLSFLTKSVKKIWFLTVNLVASWP
jgi:hypothetical protein